MFFFNLYNKNFTLNFFNQQVCINDNSYNVLKYIFSYKNINLFHYITTPFFVVLQNQKNFFYLLYVLCNNDINIIYLSSFFKRNSLKAYNTMLSFTKLSKKSTTAVMVLENNLSNSLVSKLVNYKLLFFKPVIREQDLSLNVYPLFVNLTNSLNVFIYANLVKLFVQNCKIKKYINSYIYLLRSLNTLKLFLLNK